MTGKDEGDRAKPHRLSNLKKSRQTVKAQSRTMTSVHKRLTVTDKHMPKWPTPGMRETGPATLCLSTHRVDIHLYTSVYDRK